MVEGIYMQQSNSISKKEILLKLQRFFEGDEIESIYDLNISPYISTALIYNTNDLCLNKEQFDSLLSVIGPLETIYVVQNDSDTIYEFDLPMVYEEYQSLNLFSLTVLTSSSFDWAVIIDEELESGIGFFVASNELVENFNFRYKGGLNDMLDLISFSFRDLSRNPRSIQNLFKIFSLLHVARDQRNMN